MKYKKQPNEYPDWHKYNDPSGNKQGGRYLSDELTCDNMDCSSGGIISEYEAFYLYTQQNLFKRMFSVPNLYVCPFCGKNNVSCSNPRKS